MLPRPAERPIAAPRCMTAGNCLYMAALAPFVILFAGITDTDGMTADEVTAADATVLYQTPKASRLATSLLVSDVPLLMLCCQLLKDNDGSDTTATEGEGEELDAEMVARLAAGSKEGQFHTAILWGLQYQSTYDVHVGLSATATATTTTAAVAVLTIRTRGGPFPSLNARPNADNMIDWNYIDQALPSPNLPDWLAAIGDRSAMVLLSASFTIEEVTPCFKYIFWQGMFPLPCRTRGATPGEEPRYYFNLYNGTTRFIVDFRDGEGEGEEDANAALPPPPSRKASDTPKYPWRRSRKVKRAAASGKYAVAVRETPAEVAAALGRCSAYHTSRGQEGWLYPRMVQALAAVAAEMQQSDSGGSGGDASSPCPPSSPGHARIRMLCFEVIEKASGEVMAGCCGFSIDSVYNDFSMYTLRKSDVGFGHLITKLVGEALDCCGYDMWYFGQRHKYLATYERHYGARDLSRAEFYRRFVAARDTPAPGDVAAFVRSGRAILPAI